LAVPPLHLPHLAAAKIVSIVKSHS